MLTFLVYSVLSLIGISYGLQIYSQVKELLKKKIEVAHNHTVNVSVTDRETANNFVEKISEAIKRKGIN